MTPRQRRIFAAMIVCLLNQVYDDAFLLDFTDRQIADIYAEFADLAVNEEPR